MFLAIAVDNLANAQELTAAEEAAAAEQALKVCIFTFLIARPFVWLSVAVHVWPPPI